jgi:hypothetical protein
MLVIAAAAGVMCGCTNIGAGNADGGVLDGPILCQDPWGDDDKDGIPNEYEDCRRGRDTDGDRIPDFLDTDSDGDGVLDRDEDADGDGQLGCCLRDCNVPRGTQKRDCRLTADGCGNGQKCAAGRCTPAVALSCSNGETDPYRKDTFGDGKGDSQRGTFICRDATEKDPRGRKAIKLQRSARGDWHVALEKSARYAELSIPQARPREAAAVVDVQNSSAQVAGFLVSLPGTQAIQLELQDFIAAIINNPIGDTIKKVEQRASGIQGRSHDLYEAVQGTTLGLTLLKATDISSIRNDLVAALLSRAKSKLGNLPGASSGTHTEFVIRFSTVKRFAFKKDAQGKLLDADGNRVEVSKKPPADSGDHSQWRLLVMGAVASRSGYGSAGHATGFMVDDLSNGSTLARYSDAVFDECDANNVGATPVADIIWVVDDSGSMTDNRKDIVKNATDFFARARASNLDFRMGVTNVCRPDGPYASLVGKFCSVASSDVKHDGGEDRFLLPGEQSTFGACVENPPGSESSGWEYGLVNAKAAVDNHLPRATSDKAKIRSGAQLVIIVASDEMPQSFQSESLNTCELSDSQRRYVQSRIKTYLDHFSGSTRPEAAAIFHAIVGVCNNDCGADVGHGYMDLAQLLGGQVGDVCQQDLGATLQVMIDSVVATASPLNLEYVPISTSLAVALEGKQVPRSRSAGFDYRATARGPFLVFVGVPYNKGAEVVASYKRWRQPVIIY